MQVTYETLHCYVMLNGVKHLHAGHCSGVEMFRSAQHDKDVLGMSLVHRQPKPDGGERCQHIARVADGQLHHCGFLLLCVTVFLFCELSLLPSVRWRIGRVTHSITYLVGAGEMGRNTKAHTEAAQVRQIS